MDAPAVRAEGGRSEGVAASKLPGRRQRGKGSATTARSCARKDDRPRTDLPHAGQELGEAAETEGHADDDIGVL